MAYAANLFKNAKIIGKNKKKIDLNSYFASKTIGLYFSAQWCPPCQGFLPTLVDFYNKNHEAKNFEVIYISADSDEESFQEYYGKMPWLALNFGDEDKSQELSETFHIQGIPRLVLFNADTGDVYTDDARIYIQSTDKNGDNFPWHKV